MARAATSQELTYLRSDGQVSQLGLYVYNPPSVFTALVGTPPGTTDEVVQVNITGASGDPAGVADGMTVLVGSSAGASDIGITRAISATGAVINIGDTSDINWQAGQYLTVLADWGIWARKLAFNGGVWNIEGNIAYTNQNAVLDPVPVLGPIAAVLHKTGSTVSFNPDASVSWIPDGSAISGYANTAPGASATANLASANPTLTYNATGGYYRTCSVTGANGKTSTGYRYVFVVDDAGNGAFTKLTLKTNPSGTLTEGGWSFDVTLYDQADPTLIRDRAFVVLYAQDWYAGTQVSLGPIAGYENVICCGWIEGETIHWNAEQSTVSFRVSGPARWMASVGSWPISVMDTDTTPADWMHIQGLTIDKAIWHLCHWRSTVDKICDVIPSGDTRRAFDCSANMGTLWEQLKTFTDAKIGATPGCDRYGRLVVQIDPQFVPIAARSAFPIVMAITKADWRDAVDFQKRLPSTSLIETAGFAYIDSQWTPMLSRAPGNAMIRFGSGMTSRYNLIFADQTSANALTAAIFAKLNNPYPSMPITLAQNNRLIDIVPQQYVTVSIAENDTPRGLIWTNQRLIPRRVELVFEKGQIRTNIEGEAETIPGLAVTVAPPQTPVTNYTPSDQAPTSPNFPITPYPNTSIPSQYGSSGDTNLPGAPCRDGTDPSSNGPYNVWASATIDGGQSTAIPFPFYARPSSATNPTQYSVELEGQRYDPTYGWIDDPSVLQYAHIYLIDSNGNVIVEGSGGTFNLPSGTNVAGVEVKVDGNPIFLTGIEFLGASQITIWGALTPGVGITQGVTDDEAVGATNISTLDGAGGGFPNGINQGIRFSFDSPAPMLMHAIGHCFENSQVSTPPPVSTWQAGGTSGDGDNFNVTFLLGNGPQNADFSFLTYSQRNGNVYLDLYTFTQSMQVQVWADSAIRVIVKSLNLWNICGAG